MGRQPEVKGPVLVVGPVEPPIGGVSRYCRSLVDLLRAEGLDALPCDPDRPAAGAGSVVRALGRPLGRVLGRTTLALSRAVRRHRVRLVLDNRQALWREPASARGARLLVRVPHLLAIHDGAFPAFVEGLGATARRRLAGDLGRLPGVLCMSDPILETVGRLVPAARALRVTPLLRAPDGAAPSWPAEVEAFFARPGPILCASGALHPQYGFEDLFAAVAALRRDGRPVRLVLLLGSFATEAPTAEALKEAATSLGDGTILALRDFAEGASIIARSQLYVRPSRVDSYGLALHEAMLLGVPVVASAHPTRPEGVLASCSASP